MQLGWDGQGWPWAAGQAGKGLVGPDPQGAGLGPKADEEEEGGWGQTRWRGTLGNQAAGWTEAPLRPWGWGSFEEGGVGRQQLSVGGRLKGKQPQGPRGGRQRALVCPAPVLPATPPPLPPDAQISLLTCVCPDPPDPGPQTDDQPLGLQVGLPAQPPHGSFLPTPCTSHASPLVPLCMAALSLA